MAVPVAAAVEVGEMGVIGVACSGGLWVRGEALGLRPAIPRPKAAGLRDARAARPRPIGGVPVPECGVPAPEPGEADPAGVAGRKQKENGKRFSFKSKR